MPGRPSKPIALVQGHRTKAEVSARKKQEAALLTGKSLKATEEVKNNEIARREFVRVRKMLRTIGKNDELYSGVINRYCLLRAEELEMVKNKSKLQESMEKLEKKVQNNEISFEKYMEVMPKISQGILSYDKAIMQKRKMLLDIEKENVLTIASALRSIPKKPEKKEKSAMEKYLEKKQHA